MTTTNASKNIQIQGAKEHNLQDVTLSIPRDKLVVFTGLSGSGKSSLAFDTLCREGQRRFMESLSPYARQFLGGMEKPKVDHIEGLSPTISIDQKTVGRNPRSTVGTITEVYDYLRLLFSRLGIPHCPQCGKEIKSQTVENILHSIYFEAYSSEEDGSLKNENLDSTQISIAIDSSVKNSLKHTKKAIIMAPIVYKRKGEYRKELAKFLEDGYTRVRIDGEIRDLRDNITLSRFATHTIEIILDRVVLDNASKTRIRESIEKSIKMTSGQVSALIENDHFLFATERACPVCNISMPEMEPRTFSFNNPNSACKSCYGLGVKQVYIEDTETSPNEKKYLYETDTDALKIVTCNTCYGERLNDLVRAVKFREKSIGNITAFTIDKCFDFFQDINLLPKEEGIGTDIVKEVRSRLSFLKTVGLGYLNLNRSAATLSGGEAQRIRLASQVGSSLQGVLYVLDEPSIGLHPKDHQKLLQTLCNLRDLGNSVVVVEHDIETIKSADFIVDLGPGAGVEGGHVTACGTLIELSTSNSITGRYLRGEENIPIPETRRKGNSNKLILKGARENNLKNIDIEFPIGTFIAVTGVSGSGKSTLINHILKPILLQAYSDTKEIPGEYDSIEGLEFLDKIIEIDQSPIGRTPRSNPATYTKVLDDIRSIFADLPDSKMRGYAKGRFSFNVSGGRCEKCEGSGVIEIEMQFLANVEITCEECGGKRFNHDTLNIKYKGKNISDILNMTVFEASDFFDRRPKIKKILTTLTDVGLGYISLGQPSTTLSGGEAQRVKLASELHRPATGNTLYILDEPTTGLHIADVKKLLFALQKLVDAGNTVIVIEHNMDIVKCADWVIDLGPDGGDCGGSLLFSGTPENLAESEIGYTYKFLQESLFGHNYVNNKKDFNLKQSKESIREEKKLTSKQSLTIKGAYQHNLKNINVDFPHNKLTVITGVSGSGKTSLAFDTLFAEGQRRYIESLSTYARRFLGRLEKTKVDSMEGIRPAISVDQKNSSRNPRSTVATSTEIHDYLRLLFARVGIVHCPKCQIRLESYTPESAAKKLFSSYENIKGEILLPLFEKQINTATNNDTLAERNIDKDQDSSYNSTSFANSDEENLKIHEVEISPLLANGYLRLRVDDNLIRIDDDYQQKYIHGNCIEVVLDRISITQENLPRIRESFEKAFQKGDAIAHFRAEDGRRLSFSTAKGCISCAFFITEAISPLQFSFNNYIGACNRCHGLGTTEALSIEKIIINPDHPILDGALHPQIEKIFFKKGKRYEQLLDYVGKEEGFLLHHSWKKLSNSAQNIIFYGSGDKFYTSKKAKKSFSARHDPSWNFVTSNNEFSLKWRGLINIIESFYQSLDKSQEAQKNALKELMYNMKCPECNGSRLKKLSTSIRISDLNIYEVSQKNIKEAISFFQNLEFSKNDKIIVEQILQEILNRLNFLADVGLEYLTLNRASSTLSGGESQRIRLASQLGASLMGVLYVLDEPTIGLHPRDTMRLIKTLTNLRDRGNTVVIVEHDPSVMANADHIVDIGPGAGVDGGFIIANGTPKEIMESHQSITGAFLSGKNQVFRPSKRRPYKETAVKIVNAHRNNIKNVSIDFPLGLVTCVTGVSGSGKSTFIMDIVANALEDYFSGDINKSFYDKIDVSKELKQMSIIDQSPLSRNPKSNPVSYLGAMDHIRDLFADLVESKKRGYKKGRFSFNMEEGRCPTCEGRGSIKVEMHFLSDVFIKCESCNGKQYNPATLEILYKGKNISDVLNMEVSEAISFFENHDKIKNILNALNSVGLAYMKIGQSASTLSGGEAQRVKLAEAFTKRSQKCIYILDEPTTGLHFKDVDIFIRSIQSLADKGNTIIIIEHNIDVMLSADWIIDMGPEGGSNGGDIVISGTPEEVSHCAFSHTGKAIKEAIHSKS